EDPRAVRLDPEAPARVTVRPHPPAELLVDVRIDVGQFGLQGWAQARFLFCRRLEQRGPHVSDLGARVRDGVGHAKRLAHHVMWVESLRLPVADGVRLPSGGEREAFRRNEGLQLRVVARLNRSEYGQAGPL